jgi:hypothetical protein
VTRSVTPLGEKLELSLAHRHEPAEELGVVRRGLVGLERREIRSVPAAPRSLRLVQAREVRLGSREAPSGQSSELQIRVAPALVPGRNAVLDALVHGSRW